MDWVALTPLPGHWVRVELLQNEPEGHWVQLMP
jgi:hypothetical protein